MSKLSQGIKNAVSHPLTGLANIVTLGQRDKLDKLYNSSGLRSFYNKNKSTILDTAAMAALAAGTGGLGAAAFGGNALMGAGAAGLAGGVAGGLQGSAQDKERARVQSQLNEKAAANSGLDKTLKDIAGGSAPSYLNPPQSLPQGTPTTQPFYGNQTPQQNPSMPTTQIPTGGLPFDTLSPEIQQTLAAQSPALAGRLQQIIGSGTGDAQTSAGQLLNANDLATQLSQQTLDKQTAARKQQISDLSDVLTKQAQTQYEQNLPGLYEDLNTRGLLRSSELGNQMATREQQSYEDVANQLAKQQLGYNDEAITGMGNITNQYNSGVGSALQREFSLQDYANQIKASKELGQAVAPVTPYNGKNSAAATGALGVANAGAQLGQTIGKKS